MGRLLVVYIFNKTPTDVVSIGVTTTFTTSIVRMGRWHLGPAGRAVALPLPPVLLTIRAIRANVFTTCLIVARHFACMIDAGATRFRAVPRFRCVRGRAI